MKSLTRCQSTLSFLRISPSEGSEGSTSNWCIFEPSTYGVPNGLSTCYSSIATPPSFDLVSGLYASAQQVNLTSSPNLGTVRYTLNGSEPTGSDALFPESGLTIEGNTVLRARTFGSSADVYPRHGRRHLHRGWIGPRNPGHFFDDGSRKPLRLEHWDL